MVHPVKRKSNGQSGCGFLVGTGLLILILLFVNTWLVKTVGKPMFAGWDTRIFQAVQFVFPIGMIFIEFWIYDRFISKK